jgi:all-trans-retinol 13,14-reductase
MDHADAAPAHRDDSWDAIVIGAGLGGLTCAAYLTTNGLRTLVLEQNQVAGGCSQVFRRQGKYEFDVGVHYIGDCHADGAMTAILRGLGLAGRIEFAQMDPDGYSTLVFPDLTFRVPAGWEAYLARLIETFPAEERGLRRCIGILHRIARELDRGIPTGIRGLASFPLQAPATMLFGMLPLAALYQLCGLSRQARAVICGESGDYACPPSRTPVALHAGFLHHYLKAGAYYPRGGGQVIAAHLVDVIQTHGGQVHTNVRVEKILLEGGGVTGVRLHDGRTLRAPTVVSNADIKRTYLELVGREHLSARAVRRIEHYRMALPIFSVYLGLDIDVADRMPNTNYWCYPHADVEAFYQACYDGQLPSEPPFFLTSASLKDPDNKHTAPRGHSTVEVMTVVPPDYRFWDIAEGPAAGETYSRNPEYLAIKDRLTKTLIDQAATVIPGLRDHIVFQEASTPITQERFTLSSGGACYGLELAIDQMGPRRPRPQTAIKGLYLAGASTIFCHGILGSMNGGVGTAGAVLRRDLHAEIRSGGMFGDPAKITAGGPGWDPLMASKPRAGRRAAVRRERTTVPMPERATPALTHEPGRRQQAI